MVEVQTKQGIAFVARAMEFEEDYIKLSGPVVRIEGENAFLWGVHSLRIPVANVVWHAELDESDKAGRKLAQMLAGIQPVSLP